MLRAEPIHWILNKFDLRRDSYNSEKTIETYRVNVKNFCQFLELSKDAKLQELLKLAFQGQELDKAQRMAVTECLLQYQNFLLEDRKMMESTVAVNLRAIISLLKRYHVDAYYDDLNWKRKDTKTKHGMQILTPTQMGDFAALHKGFQHVALLIRVSTACRIGVFSELRFCDIIEYKNDCMKIRFYPDPNNEDHDFTADNYQKTGQDEYYGFLTPEASRAFRAYKKEIQEKLGRKFDEKLLIYQPKWNKVGTSQNVKAILTNYATLKLKKLFVAKTTNSKTGNSKGNRSDISATHHTRKFANTILKDISGIDTGIVEHWFMNHQTGLDDSYRIITEKRFFEEFEKFIPHLTINQIEAIDLKERFKETSNKAEIEELRIDLNKIEEKRRADNMLLQQLAELYKQGLSYDEAMKKMKFPKNFYE